MAIMPSYFYTDKEKGWKIFGEEGHFSNVRNKQPTHVPFTYVFTGLGSGRRKSVTVKPK